MTPYPNRKLHQLLMLGISTIQKKCVTAPYKSVQFCSTLINQTWRRARPLIKGLRNGGLPRDLKGTPLFQNPDGLYLGLSW
ncbi:hypothetical protein CEXT_397521 [Caerostris extrusa]|uniref:Uncharacterized protein n=1 Tax=Caerostris extrusa TaxID=172846 RepID=A0AAV4N4F9_CAEEX|nr:hypothetical protein CEXT_397521 [Caerostris extrusa]